MKVDLSSTATALREFHANWQNRLEQEIDDIVSFGADLVLSDIPYLPIEAANKIGIPSVAIASLSWDHVLAAYFPLENSEPLSWWKKMRSSYAKATIALLPEPSIMGDTFPAWKSIPPLTVKGNIKKDELRRDLKLSYNDQRPVVLVSLGGIPSHTLPIENLKKNKQFHWLLDCETPKGYAHLHSISWLGGWPFRTISASVDCIVSKPGYGMSVAAAVDSVPYIYVCRGKFPDEKIIGRWMQKNNRAKEIDSNSFRSGEWCDTITELLQKQPPKPPPFNGPEIAAECIQGLL
ncbi:MAG: hypothetical protein HQL71_09680 [Magnetococcales bacterium]|nr:hypothetical protein [Magnetococcales bacterium]